MFHTAPNALRNHRIFSDDLLEDASAFFLQNKPGYGYGRGNMDKYCYEGPEFEGDKVRGGPLWDEFLRVHEPYYIKRQQDWLIDNRVSWLKDVIGPVRTIVDFGCGGEESIRSVAIPILKEFNEASFYVPLDLSKSFLRQAETQVEAELLPIKVLPREVDYTESNFILPEGKKLGMYFGASTNFSSLFSGLNNLFNAFSRSLAGGYLAVCLDLNTDKNSILHSYQHPVHTQQEVNLLYRLRRDLPIEGDLSPDCWDYQVDIVPLRTFVSGDLVKVHHVLIPSRPQEFSVGQMDFRIEAQERLVHAKSYKLSLPFFNCEASMYGISFKGAVFDPTYSMAMAVYQIPGP